MPAKAQHIRNTLAGGSENVGLVLDGVAGIFQPKTEKQEAAWLLERKGIVKMALETGASLVPIYGFGHTSLLSPILAPRFAQEIQGHAGQIQSMILGSFPHLGAHLHRLGCVASAPLSLAQVTLNMWKDSGSCREVPFVGRWGWPMGPARRIPVVMAAGQPVECPQTQLGKHSSVFIRASCCKPHSSRTVFSELFVSSGASPNRARLTCTTRSSWTALMTHSTRTKLHMDGPRSL